MFSCVGLLGLVLEHSVCAPAFSFAQKGWVVLGAACLGKTGGCSGAERGGDELCSCCGSGRARTQDQATLMS
ncbi:hypothetical protein AV530_007964 [Patagioenas fasciata monilis]|uniref:Secreted protein n=1 Tax=Patagioenas fasciata monilis TaxID=372326 RepID=A0A1V4KTU3_PATFA|nr:hypothetical protein AV530_007964 [Patagioenas fasciata monilis]